MGLAHGPPSQHTGHESVTPSEAAVFLGKPSNSRCGGALHGRERLGCLASAPPGVLVPHAPPFCQLPAPKPGKHLERPAFEVGGFKSEDLKSEIYCLAKVTQSGGKKKEKKQISRN